jgi:hypothetical protein
MVPGGRTPKSVAEIFLPRAPAINLYRSLYPSKTEKAASAKGIARTALVLWAQQDLNLRPTDYESAALTAELWARDGAKDTETGPGGAADGRNSPAAR